MSAAEYVIRSVRLPRAVYDAMERRRERAEKEFRTVSTSSLIVAACAAAYLEPETEKDSNE